MINTYQERAALQGGVVKAANVATVVGVYADGIALRLPGETAAGEKHYPYNATIAFETGQLVHLCREGGTLIVEYPIGGGMAL